MSLSTKVSLRSITVHRTKQLVDEHHSKDVWSCSLTYTGENSCATLTINVTQEDYEDVISYLDSVARTILI